MSGVGSRIRREEPSAGISVPYRVRFDECGQDGLVRTSTLLRYAQDVAWIHSERLGFDRRWYADRGLAWLVRAAELDVLRPIPLGTVLEVTTRVIGFRKVWARRRTEARLADGTLAAWGHTDWVMTDERGLATRVPDEFPGRFAVPPGSFRPGRVRLPEVPPGATRNACAARPQDIDPMAHVNNAAYLDYLEETLLAAGPGAARAVAALPRRLRLEHLEPVALGDRLVGEAWPLAIDDDGGGWAWRLTDGGGRELARGRLTAGAPGSAMAQEVT
jgi:acyl-CoA thioesterase FadM